MNKLQIGYTANRRKGLPIRGSSPAFTVICSRIFAFPYTGRHDFRAEGTESEVDSIEGRKRAWRMFDKTCVKSLQAIAKLDGFRHPRVGIQFWETLSRELKACFSPRSTMGADGDSASQAQSGGCVK